ncbi:mechanosensitive ion channel protein 6-like [Iris pallida]|uniref:Mechanosensitive ion channel protein n=1 Tax=Iris pallida TaxID=29817 RepID=A0AAX6GM11_IRIPA|nr:mechanosensitive ion channel protein 6-like [Iris pallida]
MTTRIPPRGAASAGGRASAGTGPAPRRGDQQDGSDVVRCTSNASYQQQMSGLLGRNKTRSRLMDPPPMASPAPTAGGVEANDDRKSGRLPIKSGPVGKSSSHYDEDDEDPFIDEDIPEDFKKENFNILTIVQLVSLVLILAALGCSLWIPFLQQREVWDLHLWKWELMVLVLICGRLLSGWLMRLAVYFIERNFLLRKRLLYFVYGVRKAVQNCLWLGLVLLVWHLIFDKKVERVTKSNTLPYVTKVLLCLLIAALLRLVKTLLVKVLASSFHVSTYFDRIQESLFNQYIIETLSGPPLVEIRHNMEEDERIMAEVQKLQNAGANIPSDLRAAALGKSGRVIGNNGTVNINGPRRSAQLGPTKSFKFSGLMSKKDISKEQDGITIEQLHKLNQKNVSAWNMKRLVRVVRYGTLTTLDEQLGHMDGEDESTVQIRSEHEAMIAAKKIFNNVAKPGSKYIYLVDLMRFMSEDEALKTMTLFEGAKDRSKVSRKCLKNWVVNAFRERRHLALTLNDTKTAVNKLHQMANVIVGIIIVSLWLLILNIADYHFFVVIGSQLLVAVFMFGNTLKTIFEAIIFLFVMHPFDVGDRCEINGVQMVVEEMNILTTIFLRFDNQKITCPNSQLATLFIGNYYRSPDMGDSIDFCIHVSTPVEKIAIMKQRLISYMESKPEHWYPGPQIVFREVDDMNRLRISIWMRHTINFQDMGLKWDRRELVLQEMIKVLSELEIEYRMLPVDVNVRNLPAITSDRLPSTWKTCS